MKSVEQKRLDKKMRKRRKRTLRARQCRSVEKWLQNTLGTRYKELKPPLSHKFILEKTWQLNKANFKTERLFREELLKQGISNYFPNRILLNRWFGDFVFDEEYLVIEIDGVSHKSSIQIEKDEIKDYWLRACGYCVIRVDATIPGAHALAVNYIKRLVKRHAIFPHSRLRSIARPKDVSTRRKSKRKLPFSTKDSVRSAIDNYILGGGSVIKLPVGFAKT